METISTVAAVAMDLFVIHHTAEGEQPLNEHHWRAADDATRLAFVRDARYVMRLWEIKGRKGVEFGVKQAWQGITNCGMSGITQSKLIERALEHWKEKSVGKAKTSATREAVDPDGDPPPAVGA